MTSSEQNTKEMYLDSIQKIKHAAATRVAEYKSIKELLLSALDILTKGIYCLKKDFGKGLQSLR